MADTKMTPEKAKKMFEVERTKEGHIKDFSVPDAHRLRVKIRMLNTNELTRHEIISLPSIDALEALYFMVDNGDGQNYGVKWGLNKAVFDSLRSKGNAVNIDPPFKIEYYLEKMKHADNLKAK